MFFFAVYKALIHSVPGSGTRFVCEFVEKCLGYKRSHIEADLIVFPTNNTYVQTHAWQDVDVVASTENVRVLFPLRPPYLTYLTRRYRTGRPTDTPEQKQEIIAKHWRELIRKSEYMNPLYLPVEAGLDREMVLQSIANHLEADINQEVFDEIVESWPKVGTVGGRPERDEYEKTGLIDGVTPHFLDFAIEWYEGVVLRLKVVQ